MNKPYELTATEREFLFNLDKESPRGKAFGQLKAKKYVGKADYDFDFLNLLKTENGEKYVGSLWMCKGEDAWYFNGIDGKTYIIPEPADGIDELFDIEFKRKDM